MVSLSFKTWLFVHWNWLFVIVAITSTDIGLSQFISSMVKINNPENSPSIYWEYGIFIVIAVVHGLINSISVRYNGFFNQTSLYWHLVGTLLLIIVALVLTPNKPDAKWVVKYKKKKRSWHYDVSNKILVKVHFLWKWYWVFFRRVCFSNWVIAMSIYSLWIW